MSTLHAHFKRTPLYMVLSLALSSHALAADVIILDGETATATQTLNDNETITINAGGAINTTGANAVNAFGVNNTITNSGSISTNGNSVHAILSQGNNATIINSGSISTNGNASLAIFLQGNNATIINSGSISTNGDNSPGINVPLNNATITNSGSISTNGDNSSGIIAGGLNPIINNSGMISATGSNSFSVTGFANAMTLNLLAGSQIIGRIDLGGGADIVNIYGGSVSANLTFENTGNINLFGAGVVLGDNVITVDATGESTRGVALARMSSSIHNVVSQRMNQTAPLKPVQVAALELSPGMYFSEHKPVAWAEFFGGGFDRDAEDNALGYDYDHVGVNFGYEWDVDQNRVGLMGGIVITDTETDASSFNSEANNFYIGAYGNRKINGFNITGSLLAGYGDHDNERRVIDNIDGEQVAKSDFDSFFISPALTVASAYTVSEKIELRPSANISYSMAWLDGYTETGTSNSNIKVDDRNAKALTAKAQLAAAYALSQRSELEFRVGINSRHTDDDDTVASIAGSQFKFAAVGDENVTGGFAGASLRVLNANNLTLIADLEAGGDSKEDYLAGSITLEYVF
jgi:hypothetical protein